MAKKTNHPTKPAQFGTSMTLGIDLGGTKIPAGVTTSTAYPVRQDAPGAGVDAGDRAHCQHGWTRRDAGLTIDLIDAVGIGAPGVADYNTGVIEFAPNLANCERAARPRLQSLLETPTFVETM